MKCVKFESKFTDYMKRMGAIQGCRFMVVENFRQLHTHKSRNKEKECILTNEKERVQQASVLSVLQYVPEQLKQCHAIEIDATNTTM